MNCMSATKFAEGSKACTNTKEKNLFPCNGSSNKNEHGNFPILFPCIFIGETS